MLLLLLVLVGLCSGRSVVGKQAVYENYKVLRVIVNETTSYDASAVIQLSDEVLADVWAAGRDWIDVMVSPEQLPSFQSFVYDVQYENVQSLVDHHLMKNEAARNKAAQAKLPYDFTYFPTTGEVRTWLAEQQVAYPGVSIKSIGFTYEGEDISAIFFGTSTAPTIYVKCTIHAREWISTTSCLWLIDQLLGKKDPDSEQLLRAFNWIVVPIHNIDGYDHSHGSERLWRKNRQPISTSTCIGTDLNRNYGYLWGGAGASTNPCAETFRGSTAWSAPETATERSFLQPYIRSGLAAYVDVHSYGALFLSAWDYTLTLPPDYSTMQQAMIAAVQAIKAVNSRTYTYGPGASLYLTTGSTIDYYYGEGGVVNAYTIECYGSNFTPAPANIKPIGAEVWAGIKQVALTLL